MNQKNEINLEKKSSQSFEELPRENLVDRYRGCLFGLAIGNALGTQSENLSLDDDIPTEFVGGGKDDVGPGVWTSDTSMALCLAESLLTIGDHDARDQMERYARWHEEGHLSCTKKKLSLALTIEKSIKDFIATGRPERSEQDPVLQANNGSLVRIAPVPMAFRNMPELKKMCAASSRTTHNIPVTIDACVLLGSIIEAGLQGAEKYVMLDEIPFELGTLEGNLEGLRRGDWKKKSIRDLKITSNVVTTLETAMWFFDHTGSFEDGILSILEIGNDTRGICSVYGQMAGSHYGYSGIPTKWTNNIKMKELLEVFADTLLEASLPE